MKNIKRKIGYVLKDPLLPVEKLLIKCHWIPDEPYLKIMYFLKMGKWLNLDNPQTYNEKLQWLKLYAYKPEYATMVDKYRVKEYVANIIGKEHIIPTLGMWTKAEEIDFDSLPEQFVLKCNHDSGGLVICKDKSKLNLQEVRNRLDECLRRDYFWPGRDKPYRDVKPCILAEKYMEDDKTKELRDYKFFCMDGVCKALFIAKDRQKRKEPYFDFFDPEFNHLDIKQGHPNSPEYPTKPENFEQMKEMAALLSKGIPQVRVDFYEVNGNIYFGELTFYHFGGMVPFKPEKWDYIFGSWINLPSRTV